MKSLFFKFLFSITLIYSTFAQKLDYSTAISSNFGNSYSFYSFSENLIDLNFFYNDFQGWVQYEYSNPPDIGFVKNDFRKFRFEYRTNLLDIKLGDIYEIWGRGLVLNQIDDQSTNFDNGLRGLFLEFNKGPLTLTHINGNSDIWKLGLDLREPFYNDKHNLFANRIQIEKGSATLGINQLISSEKHSKLNLDKVDLGHTLNGLYGSYSKKNIDLFMEYVDKISIAKNLFSDNLPNDTLKRGHGFYGNINFYLGNWGLTTEIKKYSFDVLHSDQTPNDYGNQIPFQQMPTLGKEHNSTLLRRLSHNYNFNDERGIQLEINGSIFDFSVNAQYAHLSRNELWQSEDGPFSWVSRKMESNLPSSNISSLPYYENYQEISGYLFNDKVFFKLGRGSNREVLGTNWFFNGLQTDSSYALNLAYDTTYSPYAPDYPIITIDSLFDTSVVSYDISAKNWRESVSFTLPIEIDLVLEEGLSVGASFQYQERSLSERRNGNALSYNVAKSKWNLVNSDDPLEFSSLKVSQLSLNGKSQKIQYNRLASFSFRKARKWSFTLTQDWTTAYEVQTEDPYYNPLEAFLFGDLKYFTGKRNKTKPPSFIQNKWVSAEFVYNISSSQRLSIMYGSMQGGLFCNNGICRLVPPFNDGLKVGYVASF